MRKQTIKPWTWPTIDVTFAPPRAALALWAITLTAATAIFLASSQQAFASGSKAPNLARKTSDTPQDRLDFVSAEAFKVEERTLSVAKNSDRPLDISPEMISRVVRKMESERRYAGSGYSPIQNSMAARRREPGIDGPWSDSHHRERQLAKIQVYTFDTRDVETCTEISKRLKSLNPAHGSKYQLNGLCDNSDPEAGHVAQIAVAYPSSDQEFRTELSSRNLSPSDQKLFNDTRNLSIGMAGTMGLLWSLPGEVTGWDKEAYSAAEGGVFDKYVRNIRAGPVWDKDNAVFNFVLHPMAGGAYYSLSRNNGKSPWESLGYAVAMSTFFWEYGFEAIIEKPSIQDLFITPLLGSILGEAAYQYQEVIRRQGGTLLGSKTLGSFAMILLNPAGALSDAINRALGTKVIKDAKADLVLKRYSPDRNNTSITANYIGIQVSFKF